MKCPFCNRTTGLNKNPAIHLVVTVDDENITHVHGPMRTEEDRQWMVRMIADIAKTAGIEVGNLPELIKKQSLETHHTIQ
jgi:hypothetical protein